MALTKISTDGVKDDAVTSGKIPANAVGSSELADNAVDTAAIANDAVTAAKIAASTITQTEMATDSVSTDEIAANAITATEIAASAVSTSELADDAVTQAKIADGAVITATLGDGVVNTSKLADNAITGAKIGNDQIETSKLTTAAKNAEDGLVKYLRTGNGVYTIITPDGSTVSTSSISATYAQSGTTITITKANHYYPVGSFVNITFTGGATSGTYRIQTITDDGNADNVTGFTVTELVDGTTNSATISGGTACTFQTVTEGLQEAINYANAKGLDFFAAGGGIETEGSNTDIGVISCGGTLQIPPCQNRSFVFKSLTLDFNTSAGNGMGTNPGLKFDSFMMMDFDFAGQVGYHGTGNAVEFDPVNAVPYDGSPAQVDSRIKVETIAYIEHGIAGPSPVSSPDCACVKLARSSGGAQVSRNHFFFGEINGSGFDNPNVTLHARHGISVAHHGVFGNIFDISGIHHITESGILMGYATNVQAPYGNTFRIGLIEPFKINNSDANTAYGIKSYGSRNDYNFAITNNGGGAMGGRYGSFSHAVHFDTAAINEYVFLRRSEGASNGFVQVSGSTNNDNTVYHDGALVYGFGLIGTVKKTVFNGAGGNSKLVVAGSDTATSVVSNVNSSICISNTDGTANNLAGLHFARENSNGTGFPHYCGASIVTQFREAQTDNTYPSADLNFLTSHAHGNAPRLSATLSAAGFFTTPHLPFFRVDGPDSNTTYDEENITWTNVLENTGSHFKTTSGTGQMQRFIAPVAGHYLFTIGFFPNSASNARVRLEVNGSSRTDPYISGIFTAWGTGAPTPSGAQVLKLAANDYVHVRVQGTITNTYGGHSGWQGVLLS